MGVKVFEPSIHGGERFMHQVYDTLSTTRNSWFTYRLLHTDFYLYVNLALHIDSTYGFITYKFIIYGSKYVITYGSKYVCKLPTDFMYRFIT